MFAFHRRIRSFRDDLFTVQTTPPIRPHWHTALWGVVGLFASFIYILFPLPQLLAQLPSGSVAITAMLLRVAQVALLGAWIVWRQPWRATSPAQQRLGRLVMVMTAVLLFPAVAPLFLDLDWEVLPYYLVTVVCLLQIFWLSRRGLVRLAALLLTLTLIVQQIGISALSSSNGIGPASAPLIYGLIILVGGFTVGWWFGLLVAVALPATITLLASLNLIAMPPDWTTTGLYIVMLSTYAGLTALYTHGLNTALTTAEQHASALEKTQALLQEQNVQLTIQARALQEAQAMQQHLIEEQERRIAEAITELRARSIELRALQTPLIPVVNGVLAAPLIGAWDTERADEFVITLLRRIERDGVHTALIDLTGVTMMNDQVARLLHTAVKGARLLGCRCVLVGVQPESAEMLVQMGFTVRDVATAHNLAEGVVYALHLSENGASTRRYGGR